MEINGLLAKSEYNFIKTNPDLYNVVYLVMSGSHAYGTDTSNSDIDLRGVLIEPQRRLLGLEPFEQFDDVQTDTVIFSLKKFATLLTKANPNIIELLGVDEDCIVVMTEQGEKLRSNSALFLSTRVVSSFGNYALAQLRRLQNALYRDSFTENQKMEHLKNTLNAQMDHMQRMYSNFSGGKIVLSVSDRGLLFDIDLKNYPVADFVGIYSEMASITKSYNKLNHRNNKKSDKQLYKHAMHLIRLLMTGTDILLGKGIVTRRREEQNLLLAIRNGSMEFAEIFNLVNEFQKKFYEAAELTKLPYEPDSKAIDDLLVNIYETEYKIGRLH